ncbi:MAG: pantoate--beta-alanine ligase [Rhodothermales bacterium]|nr:pantoate--beta-alanine ligase [Rhodothermales bacterium]
MTILASIEEMQAQSDAWRRKSFSIALVPTMGALHAGHMELVRTARRLADRVIVSIFVNPTQFAPGEDFEEYPRDLETDCRILREEGGVDVVFAPHLETMYPPTSNATKVEVYGLTDTLCGPHRPGHFTGVATIVARLLNICKPDFACFGQKDIQQFAIVRKMVKDLNMDVHIEGVGIVREPDGLALSSRNRYLGEEARRQSTVLSMAVTRAADLIASGVRSASVIEDQMREIIETSPLADLQYVEVVDGESLARVRELTPGRSAIAATAVYFGETRLIDNTFIPKVPD